MYWANFSEACHHHDDCYSGCSSRWACDVQLGFEIGEACKRSASPEEMQACFAAAQAYYVGVTLGATNAYRSCGCP
jgi:hypothetical protein